MLNFQSMRYALVCNVSIAVMFPILSIARVIKKQNCFSQLSFGEIDIGRYLLTGLLSVEKLNEFRSDGPFTLARVYYN